MCCIIACIDKKMSLELMQKVHLKNSDGIGFGWFQDGMPHYKKALMPQAAFEFSEALELPFVMHFRAASVGMSKSNNLCHPFEVTPVSELKLEGNAPQLLMHNGTVGGYRILLAATDLTEPYHDSASDSRAISMILAKLGDINKQQRLLKSIGGRFVLMDAASYKFKLFGSFVESWEYPGMKFSNFDWRYETKVYQSSDYYSSFWPEKKKESVVADYKVVDKKNQSTDGMTADEKAAHERHLTYEKNINEILQNGEKYFCKTCNRQLTHKRAAYLKGLSVPKLDMLCLDCKQTRATTPVNTNPAPVLIPEVDASYA